MNKHVLSIMILAVLSGCTSLSDFQQMDTLTRTDFVCVRDNRVSNISSELKQARDKKKDVRKLLNQGYRVVKTCDTQTIKQPKEICTQNKERGVLVSSQCRVVNEPTVSETCRETPINIDSKLETERLNSVQQRITYLEGQRDAAFQSCFNRVGAMTAEEAYQYYQQN